MGSVVLLLICLQYLLLQADSPMPIRIAYYFHLFNSYSRSRNYFGDCTLGDWCALGRYLTDNANETNLECPANTYCTNSSILTPTACYCDSAANNCSYCPLGSTTEQPCPRGYYCEGPSNIQACKLSTI